MREQGRSRTFILGTWLACAGLLTLAVVLGAGPLSSAAPETLSLPLAFAAGAVLASLADTPGDRASRETDQFRPNRRLEGARTRVEDQTSETASPVYEPATYR